MQKGFYFDLLYGKFGKLRVISLVFKVVFLLLRKKNIYLSIEMCVLQEISYRVSIGAHSSRPVLFPKYRDHTRRTYS